MAKRGKPVISPIDLPKPERKYCPDCVEYINGVKTAVWSAYAGMQYHRSDEGTIYDKVGTYTPCHCLSGDLVSTGFKNIDDNKIKKPKDRHGDMEPVGILVKTWTDNL